MTIENTVSAPALGTDLDTTDSEPFTSAIGQALIDGDGLVDIVCSVQGSLLGIGTALDVSPAAGRRC